MNTSVKEYVEQFMADVVAKNPGELEFHQAVREVVESVAPYIMENPQLVKMKVLERIAEPERVIMFRVPWVECGLQGLFDSQNIDCSLRCGRKTHYAEYNDGYKERY